MQLQMISNIVIFDFVCSIVYLVSLNVISVVGASKQNQIPLYWLIYWYWASINVHILPFLGGRNWIPSSIPLEFRNRCSCESLPTPSVFEFASSLQLCSWQGSSKNSKGSDSSKLKLNSFLSDDSMYISLFVSLIKFCVSVNDDDTVLDVDVENRSCVDLTPDWREASLDELSICILNGSSGILNWVQLASISE